MKDDSKNIEEHLSSASVLLKFNVIVFFLYVVTGYFGLKLALPPGYASAIFPPAGIALGFIILLGLRIIPAIFLGSLVLNSLLAFAESGALLSRLGAPIIIAIGATLQSYFGYKIFERFLGRDTQLINERTVFSFIVWLGIVSCMFNATWSVTGLVLVGKIPAVGFFNNWLMWWIGDSVGAMTVAPIIISMQNNALWRPRRWIIILPSLALFTGIVAIYIWAGASLIDKRNLELKKGLADTAAILRQRITAYEDAVRFTARFMESSTSIPNAKFQAFLEDISDNLPGMKVIAWAPSEFANNGAHFTAKIEFLTPPTGNEKALGFDLASEPIRREMLTKAMASGQPTASRGIRLVQEGDQTQEQLSILMAAPVRVFDSDGFKVRGFVSAAIRLHDIFSPALNLNPTPSKIFRIVDMSPGGRLLYPPAFGTSQREETASEATSQAALAEILTIGGRQWKLIMVPEALGKSPDLSAWFLLFIGLLSTALLEAFLLVVTGKTALINGLVETRTQELSNANAKLSSANAELEQFAYIASHDLQTPVRHVSTYAKILEAELAPIASNEHREALRIIIYSVTRMRAMLDDLMLFTSVSHNNLDSSPVDLNAIVTETLNTLRSEVESSKATITSATLPYASCDGELIGHVFKNLIHNAIRHARGDVPPVVHISYSIYQDEVHICVQDNGVGISSDHYERVFKIFQRLSKKHSTGTGIGLAICKKIIERHRCRIWLESQPGHGSSFFFSLPITGGQENAAA